MMTFILLSAVINLAIGSASAKWAIMAPVFVPMFMLLDYSPELVQVAYRIGDSTTNIISPIDVVFCSDRRLYAAIRRQGRDRHSRRHDVAYTIVFLMIWMALLTIWLLAGLPVGPGASLFL